MKNLLLVLVIITISTINLLNAQVCPFTDSRIKGSSTATFYEAVDNGACGYQNLFGELGPKTNQIAALNSYFFNHSYQCGQCYRLSYSSSVGIKSMDVVIVDECPDDGWCNTMNTHFDINQKVFANLQTNGGTITSGMSFTRIPCAVDGNVKIRTKDGTNPWWTSFMIFNHRVGIEKVEVQLNGATNWIALERTTSNYWPANFACGTDFKLRITSVLGESIIANMPRAVSYDINDSGAQFNMVFDCGGGSIPTNTPTNTPTNSPTNTPTNSPTNTPTNSPTNTPTNSPTYIPTNTPTNTPTYTPTNTPTNSPTNSPTNTPTNSPSNTPTLMPTITPTATPRRNCSNIGIFVQGEFALGWDIYCFGSASYYDSYLDQITTSGPNSFCTVTTTKTGQPIPIGSNSNKYIEVIASSSVGRTYLFDFGGGYSKGAYSFSKSPTQTTIQIPLNDCPPTFSLSTITIIPQIDYSKREPLIDILKIVSIRVKD